MFVNEWIQESHINDSAVKLYARRYENKKEKNKYLETLLLLKAITLIDLTTLSGDDTISNITELVNKALFPIPDFLRSKVLQCSLKCAEFIKQFIGLDCRAPDNEIKKLEIHKFLIGIKYRNIFENRTDLIPNNYESSVCCIKKFAVIFGLNKNEKMQDFLTTFLNLKDCRFEDAKCDEFQYTVLHVAAICVYPICINKVINALKQYEKLFYQSCSHSNKAVNLNEFEINDDKGTKINTASPIKTPETIVTPTNNDFGNIFNPEKIAVITTTSFSSGSVSFNTTASIPDFGASFRSYKTATLNSFFHSYNTTALNSVFGQSNTTASNSVFGQSNTTTSVPVFGASNTTASIPVFGASNTTASIPVFGASNTTAGSVVTSDITRVTASSNLCSTSVNMMKENIRVATNAYLPIAAVAAGFPSGQYPICSKQLEIQYCVSEGASEIDIVIDRSLVIGNKWSQLYDNIHTLKNACGEAKMKTILSVGECGSLSNVYKASMVAMMAGSDFIKTSTGKESVNATFPVGIVMCRAISNYYKKTGRKAGFDCRSSVLKILLLCQHFQYLPEATVDYSVVNAVARELCKCKIMSEIIKQFHNEKFLEMRVGFKPAGGIKTADDVICWLKLIIYELGPDWLPLFRIGASGVLSDIVKKLQENVSKLC